MRTILPTPESITEINEDFKILIGRNLVTYVPCLKKFEKYVEWHTPHQYSDAMEKSTFLVRDIYSINFELLHKGWAVYQGLKDGVRVS